MDRFLRSCFLIDLPNQIEQYRIHLRAFIASPVAQKAVQLAQTFRIIPAIAFEGDGCCFLGMGIVQGEGSIGCKRM